MLFQNLTFSFICRTHTHTYIQSQTVTEYIYLNAVLKYNFEGFVLYLRVIFEYS